MFQWDEKKRQKIIKERGVGIVYAALIFENIVLTRIDNREDYGEIREIFIDMILNECFIVVHTKVENEIKLITAWKGGRKEREQYQKGIARRT